MGVGLVSLLEVVTTVLALAGEVLVAFSWTSLGQLLLELLLDLFLLLEEQRLFFGCLRHQTTPAAASLR